MSGKPLTTTGATSDLPREPSSPGTLGTALAFRTEMDLSIWTRAGLPHMLQHGLSRTCGSDSPCERVPHRPEGRMKQLGSIHHKEGSTRRRHLKDQISSGDLTLLPVYYMFDGLYFNYSRVACHIWYREIAGSKAGTIIFDTCQRPCQPTFWDDTLLGPRTLL